MDAANVLVEEVMEVWERALDAKWISLGSLEERASYKQKRISRKSNVEILKISCKKFLEALEEEEGNE